MKLDLTPEFRRALDLLERGDRNLFITGRAGTGKSTLLQHFRATTRKNVAVLAPTGVAAINVGGETIHSFFGFKPDITPDRVRKASGARKDLCKSIDTLVIDEVSMVRADLLDAVAKFLELNGKSPRRPFGGIQMVLFGDLYQLPPVVQSREEDLFCGYYESPYFFSAGSFDSMRPEWIDLTKVFRQTDEEYLQILNRVRNGTVSEEDLARLNSRVREEEDMEILDDFLVLTTTNNRAGAINRIQLDRLPSKRVTFTASTVGQFDAASFPTDYELVLKERAQVMLLNNDSFGRWINGTIARIETIDAKKERLGVTLPDGSEEEIKPYRWDMFHFELDPRSRRLIPVSIGQFIQFPVRLAWAITIHKSQGMTLDSVVFNAPRSLFAAGQAYVGLSRARSLDRLLLRRPLRRQDILLSPDAVGYRNLLLPLSPPKKT